MVEYDQYTRRSYGKHANTIREQRTPSAPATKLKQAGFYFGLTISPRRGAFLLTYNLIGCIIGQKKARRAKEYEMNCCKEQEGKYCTECGQKLPAAEMVIGVDYAIRFCKSALCVKKVRSGELYCGTCFKKLVGLGDVPTVFDFSSDPLCKRPTWATEVVLRYLREKFSEKFLQFFDGHKITSEAIPAPGQFVTNIPTEHMTHAELSFASAMLDRDAHKLRAKVKGLEARAGIRKYFTPMGMTQVEVLQLEEINKLKEENEKLQQKNKKLGETNMKLNNENQSLKKGSRAWREFIQTIKETVS